jgi:hypothetical protein
MKKYQIGQLCLGLIFLAVSASAVAAPNVGFITRVTGDVEIYTNPASSVVKDSKDPHVKFEDKYYTIKKGKRGFRLKNGFVVTAGPKSKARVVFKNGDQITVSADSAYAVNWSKGKKETGLMLYYGNVRAMIKKGGPRSNMKVKTRSATMGVRGTDFHVNAWGKKGGTALTVLRGSVTIKQASAKPEIKPVLIPAGATAEVKAAPKPKKKPVVKTAEGKIIEPEKEEPAPAPMIVVKKTSKQALVVIQHSTKVEKAPKPQPKNEEEAEAIKEEEAELAELETKAVEATMDDIKTYDPKLYEVIQKKQATAKPDEVLDVDDIQSETVKELFKEAPSDPGETKPSLDDLDSDDVYEKYRWGLDD